MQRNLRKLVVIVLVLFLTGFAKLPIELKLTSDLREQGLLEEPLDLDTRIKLGQTTYAIALGGLRSLVASLKNLSAHNHFANQDWFQLEEEYKTITILQPKVRYYWETGSWHLAYNAYADYADKPGVPEARRRLAQKDFLARGRRMLELGVENNPKDWRLHQALGRLLKDPFKPNDFPASAAVFEKALQIKDAPQQLRREYLYVLTRVPGREEDAWKIAQEVFSDPSNRRYPSTQSTYFVLQHKFANPAKQHTLIEPAAPLSLEEIFGSRKRALRNLSWYSRRKREGFPMDGVRETLQILVKEFNVPDKYNPLLNKDWHGYPKDFFGELVPEPEETPNWTPEEQENPAP